MSDETRSRRTLAKSRTEARASAMLHIVWPVALARSIKLGGEPLILGRKPESGEGRLQDETVSRQHLVIEWEGGAHRVKDLGSRNGSKLDGKLLSPNDSQPLQDQSVLRAGDVMMVYDAARATSDVDPGSNAAVPGRSIAIAGVRAAVRRAAGDPAPVLLIGDTGTGKEMIAREVHRESRRPGPLVAVNCAELSRELFESQLFGHLKGSFTGALRDEPGLFRTANGGTLFLDEVGELAGEQQAKLLRVIQEGEVRAIGATNNDRVDVRIIAATNVDLPMRVEQEKFRRDLYARLSLWEIRVPPLASRRADVIEWLQLLYERWAEKRGVTKHGLELEADAAEALLLASWPENLRGVDRLVHRLASEARAGAAVSLAQVAPLIAAPVAAPTSKPRRAMDTIDEAAARPEQEKPSPPKSKEELEKLLQELGSVRALAKHYGRERRQIYRWLKAFGIRE